MISSIPYMFSNTLNTFSNKDAIIHGDNSITFQSLYEKVLICSHILTEFGILKGDRVGICMNKSIDQVIAILAVIYSNAVFVPILPKLKNDNIKHIISDSGMSLLITDSKRIEEVKNFSNKVKLIIGSGKGIDGYPVLPEMCNNMDYNNQHYNCIGHDNAAIIYSSGSTGRPKGIVLSHRNLYDGTRIVSSYLNTIAEDRIAGILSFNFDYGLNQLWQTIYKGATIYLHDLVFPNDFFDLLSRNNITVLPVMPVIITKLFDPRFYKINTANDYSSLRYICSSGGRVSEQMIDGLKSVFPNTDIVLMYGLTEAFRSTFLPSDQLVNRPTSIGKAIPDVEILVLDKNNKECGPRVQGELVHRGGCITKGYWNDIGKTSKVFRELPEYPGEKLIFSGDIVEKDEEGYLYFITRSDSMIKTYGYRVSPTEIESAAIKHEKITEAVVFGVSNQDIGQDIVLVYTTLDQKPIIEKLLLQFLKEQLPRYMVPKYIHYLIEFPSTGNEGKVDRLHIEKQVRSEIKNTHKV